MTEQDTVNTNQKTNPTHQNDIEKDIKKATELDEIAIDEPLPELKPMRIDYEICMKMPLFYDPHNPQTLFFK